MSSKKINSARQTVGIRKTSSIKKDLQNFKEEILHQFHMISEGLIDQIKLLAEGHSGIIQRLEGMQGQFDQMRKENERQHLETRSLIKISFSELDKRISNLESQVKELQEWRKQIEGGPRI
jgi:vacuolar-type H+-ATPase subunit I/STV1